MHSSTSALSPVFNYLKENELDYEMTPKGLKVKDIGSTGALVITEQTGNGFKVRWWNPLFTSNLRPSILNIPIFTLGFVAAINGLEYVFGDFFEMPLLQSSLTGLGTSLLQIPYYRWMEKGLGKHKRALEALGRRN